MIRNEKEFQNLPKLRWKFAVDRTIIAVPRSKRFCGDDLYFHGKNVLGIYYQHGPKRLAYYKSLLGKRIVKILGGETDGIILFKAIDEKGIPRIFFRGRQSTKVCNLPNTKDN